MKLFCLSGHANKPCYILRVKDVTIMLDCSLVTQTVLNFLPLSLVPTARLSNLPNYVPRNCPDPQVEGELKDCDGRVFVNSAPEFCTPLQKLIDFSEIDVILISNYETLLALPFITENTGFHGVVYMSEPTLLIGRLYLEELVEYIERTPKPVLASHWKEVLHTLPPPLSASMKPRSWQQIYSWNAIHSSLSKVQPVFHEQELDIFGTLKVMTVNSGYCLGSCNWIIRSDYQKLVYISNSSTLTTHPGPIMQDYFKRVDMVMVTSLTPTVNVLPDSALTELCQHTITTLRNNGNVLFPCYSSGIVYDLFECLASHLDSQGLSQIPIYFISPVAHSSLGYSNILAEWLADERKNKVFLPEEPYFHAQLLKSGRLKPVKRIYDDGFCNEIKHPCVVFCGHPSLRFGDSVHFVELWGSNPQNLVVFTETEFNHVDALAPFQPLMMKSVYCPIDTNLTCGQINKILREMKPSAIILPDTYLTLPYPQAHRSETAVEQPTEDTVMYSIRRGEVLTLPIKRRKVIAKMSLDLAQNVHPLEVKPGYGICSITGVFTSKDNKYKITNVENLPGDETSLKPKDVIKNWKHEWGVIDIPKFVKNITSQGFKDVRVERSLNGSIIHLQEEDTLIQTEDNCTHIFCEAADTEVRLRLKNAALACLNRF